MPFRLTALCRLIVVGMVAVAGLAWAAPARATLLYDQSGGTTNIVSSQDFEPAADSLDSEVADDFTVPPGETWTIDSMTAFGAGAVPPQARVRIFAASGTLPGAELYATVATQTSATADLVVPLANAPQLPPGHYWISVQGILDYGADANLWYAFTRPDQAGDLAAWRNPGNYFGTGCIEFKALDECYPGEGYSGMVFSLSGTADSTLTVSPAGAGSGSVSSEPSGIACGLDCTEVYSDGTPVTLTATPAAGSDFAGFAGGGCSGPDPCTVTMGHSEEVTATFTVQRHTLSVRTDGNGSGSVAVDGAPCAEGSCDLDYDHGTEVELTATPDANSDFTTWTGGGCGAAATCTVTMDAAKTVTATFTLKTATVGVSMDGTGGGVVSGTGIDCPGDCTETADYGTVITLTADSDADSTFAGWTGCDDERRDVVSEDTCTVTVGGDRSVTATFVGPERSLRVTTAGAGSGFVDSAPEGIDCGNNLANSHHDCVQEYTESTTVTLTAHPSIGSTFTGFSGDCQVGEARAAAAVVDVTCRVAVNGVKSVAAGFTPTSGGGGGGGGGGGPVGGSGGTPPPGGGGSGGTVTPLVSPTLALSERHRRSITVSLDPGTLASNVILTCGLRVGGHRVGHVKRLTQGLGAGTPATVSIRISPALRQRIRAAHKAGKKARLKLKAVFYAADGTITVRRLTIRR